MVNTLVTLAGTSGLSLGLIPRFAVVALALTTAGAFAAEPPRGSSDPTTVLLDIPPRQQWRELHGYCGECSIQQAALFYGAYVSQYVCREIVNPSQRKEVLVGVNEDLVLDTLRFQYEQFPVNLARAPQYQPYMQWIKQHLQQGHPTLIVAYAQEGTDPDYDHIMLAIGCKSTNFDVYQPEDVLSFNDCFAQTTQRRKFRWLPDTQEMRANGRIFEFCIPYRYDYGCAITGIQDDSGTTVPVQVLVDQAREPNLPLGAPPVVFEASVVVGGLTPGRGYALYRYNDYRRVPTNDYESSEFDGVRQFIAEETVQTFSDEILSNGVAIYRCVPTGP